MALSVKFAQVSFYLSWKMNVIENQNNKLENKCIVSFYSNKRGIDIVS